MDQTDMADLIQKVIDDYCDQLHDLNDLDTSDLADNIAAAIEHAK